MSRVENFLLGGRHNRTAVHVGLVNNMPDADMRATELQFAKLLKDSAGALDVRLRLFSFRGIARSEQARSRMDGFYDDAEFLQAASIDALIVTGAGEGDPRLQPHWQELTQLIDWAETGTLSTIFSGPAAQAAVLHLDGIAARALPRKLAGVFPAMRVEDDPLFFSQTLTMPVPHGRSHDIPEEDLGNYRVLSRLAASSSCRAIPNMTAPRWAANICATWNASMAARRPSLPLCRKTISTAPPKTGWPRRAPIWPAPARSYPRPCRCNPGGCIPGGCSPTG